MEIALHEDRGVARAGWVLSVVGLGVIALGLLGWRFPNWGDICHEAHNSPRTLEGVIIAVFSTAIPLGVAALARSRQLLFAAAVTAAVEGAVWYWLFLPVGHCSA